MPHLMIDYSANMEDRVDIAGLCDALRIAAIDTGILPMAGVRVRAMRADHVSIADGDEMHGFVDISVRLREGRPQDAKASASARIFAAAEQYLSAAIKRYPMALSLEMRDIDASLSPKLNTIRAYLNKEKPDV